MAQPEFDEIAETFEFLDDWEDRYRHVIEMGKAMPEMDEALKVAANKVHGCASQVWVYPDIQGEGKDAVFGFWGDSDALIVRGLIAVLHALFAGRKLGEIAQIDAGAALTRIGLADHLSAQRSNGLRAMVERLKLLAAERLADGKAE